MTFLGHGRFVAAACIVWWTCVSLTTAQATNTTGQGLWPDYKENSYNVSSVSRFGFVTAIPFPYYECKAFSVGVYGKGYVVFGPEYDAADPPAPAQWPYLPKLLGVYWSKLISFSQKTDSIMFTNSDDNRLKNVTYENSLIRYVKNAISDPDFEPLSIIAATWVDIRPLTNDSDTATFQVLLATDSQVTYSIRGYQSVWKSPEIANVTYYAATYSLGYGDRPKIVLPGSQPGPEVIRLGTKKPNKDPYTCVEKTQAVVSRLNSSLSSLPPCPCYQFQALEDQHYRTSDASPRCYQTINLPQGGTLYQLCCYNMYGHLLNFTKEAPVPVAADASDHSLQEAYEKCCAEGSALCEWFHDRVYLTKCANYTPAFKASELPIFYNSDREVLYDRIYTINVGLSVKNNIEVTYSLMTTFNSSHGVNLGGSLFYWFIKSSLNELRKASYPQQLVIYATDANNMSTAFAPLYRLCLCEEVNQCQQVKSFTYTTNTDKYGMGAFFGVDSYEKGNVNVMTCQCKGNSTGRFCEKQVNFCDNCLVQYTAGCYSNTQDYCPTCPSGYQRYGTQCTEQPLWLDYVKYGGKDISSHFTIFTAIPFPYYECKAYAVRISSSGFLSFGPEYNGEEPPPPAEWPYLPKLMGIYWTELTRIGTQTNSYTYVNYDDSRLQNVRSTNSLIRYIKDAISDPDFEPLFIITATWVNIRPPTNDSDTATFQVVLATDSQVTFAIRYYESVWKSPALDNVTYYAATYSLGYGDRPKIVLPGSQQGPEVIRLSTKRPNKDPYSCVEKTQAVVSRLNSSLYSLPPCPCYQYQASEDQQFKSTDSSSRCYQSISLPPQGGDLYQLCCYNMYGHLLNFTKETRVPVPSDPSDRSLQEAYEKCCAEGSALCEWFHSRIYLTKCANYTPAFNASELPVFYNSEKEVLYNRTVDVTVGLSVKNSTGVTYSLMTTFSSSHGVSLNGMWLRWSIASSLNELRKASYPKQLVIYATDANNLSTAFAPLYKLCLCEEFKQCHQGTTFTYTPTKDRYGSGAFFGVDSYEKGNVNVMECQCKGNGTGRFCEKPVNVCDNCLVQNRPGCNFNPPNYCPACPSSYERSGTQCLAPVQPEPSPVTPAPENSGQTTDIMYLLDVLSCITSVTLTVQNLNTRM